jgi:ATP-binding cassette subfamily B protein
MPLGQAFGALNSVNQALGALGRIQEIIALPTETETDAEIAASALPPVDTDAAVSFDGVEFRYAEGTIPTAQADAAASTHATTSTDATVTGDAADDAARGVAPSAADLADLANAADITGITEAPRDRTVLHGVSFSAARGQRTALVGPSGAGKSTILALIERFYDPSAGVVRLGGVDIRSMDRTQLRSKIGYVEQDAPVLAGSLRDNLTLGAPDASDDQCVAVLHAVNLTEVLERNGLGLDAPVGEDGIMLSGGERQRLAIARALLAAPPILLLDESTSSLDGRNEQLMREAIDAVAEDRTLIVIAHRLSTVVDSDQIVVLDHGRVVGMGTHSELVNSTPLYRDLAKHQLLV